MSVVSFTIPAACLRARCLGVGGVLALTGVFAGAEESVVSVVPINGGTQVHVTSTATGRIIPPNQNGQFRVSLSPAPLESAKTFYLQMDGQLIWNYAAFTLLWNHDLDGDGVEDVLVEQYDPVTATWSDIVSAVPPIGGYDHAWTNDFFGGVYMTSPDMLRVTIQPGFSSVDFAIQGDTITGPGNYLAAKIHGIETGFGEGTVTGSAQAVNFQLITDNVVARNVVFSPNVREMDGTLNGNKIYGDNSAYGRVWFGCEAWNPAQTISTTAHATSLANRNATQLAQGYLRVLTQSLVQDVVGVGVATSGSDFTTTLRFGAARYNGEGIASTGPNVRDDNALVVDEKLKVSEYAYRRTTEWGPSRVQTVYIAGALPGGWAGATLTLSTGDTVTLWDSVGSSPVDEVDVSSSGGVLTMTFPQVVPAVGGGVGGPRSWPVEPGSTVQFVDGAGVALGAALRVIGTANPVTTVTDTYNPRNNGVTRTLAGNEARLNIHTFVADGVTVPDTAKKVKVFFPNLQGDTGAVYYNAPAYKTLNGGDFGGLLEVTVSTSGAGRPYGALGNINPTRLRLNWATDPSTAGTSPTATLGGVALTTPADYTLGDGNTLMTLTAVGQGKLNAGDPTREFLEGKTVTFGAISATVATANLATPANDPLQYGATGIKQGEKVNVWYEEEKNTVIYISGAMPTPAPAKVTIGGAPYYAAKGENGTAPAADQFTVSTTEFGLTITLTTAIAVPVAGTNVTFYPAKGGSPTPDPMFDVTKPDAAHAITGVPQVKLTTKVNEPVLYGNPNGTGTYCIAVTGGNYAIAAGDQVRALGKDPTDPAGGDRVWTCYGRSTEGATVLTDKRAMMWTTTWEDATLQYVVLAGTPPATYYIPRNLDATLAQLKAHLAVPWTNGNVTVSIPARITQSETYGGIYPVPDFGHPAQGSFQQGDYMEYFYKPVNDHIVEGVEKFSVVTRQDVENNGFEVMFPQSATFTVWDDDSVLSLVSSPGLMAKVLTATTTILASQEGSMSFTLTQALPQDVTIAYTVTASAGLTFKADYDIPGASKKDGVITGEVKILAGSTSAAVRIVPKISTAMTVSDQKYIYFNVQQSPSYALNGTQSSAAGLQAAIRYTRTVTSSSTPPADTSGNGTDAGKSTGGLNGDDVGGDTSKSGSGCGAGSGLGLLAIAGLALGRRTLRRQKGASC